MTLTFILIVQTFILAMTIRIYMDILEIENNLKIKEHLDEATAHLAELEVRQEAINDLMKIKKRIEEQGTNENQRH